MILGLNIGKASTCKRQGVWRLASRLAALLSVLLFVVVAIPGEPRHHRNQVEFRLRGGASLLLDASFPATGIAVPAVVVVHGGGWEAGDRRTYVNPLLAWLEDSPYAWFSVDYRLAPAFPYPAAVEDVEDALAWIHEHAAQFRVDPDKLVLAGESSGGHLVSLVGARVSTPLAGVVSFYGIHNFASWFPHDRAPQRNASLFLQLGDLPLKHQLARVNERVRQASPVNHVRVGMPPFLLIHGEEDAGVPVSQSQEMCGAMRGANAVCDLFVLPGAGHGMENWERDPALAGWKSVMRDWLHSVLPR